MTTQFTPVLLLTRISCARGWGLAMLKRLGFLCGFLLVLSTSAFAQDIQGNPAGTQISQNEINSLRTRISQCWLPPAGINATSNLYVVVRVLLNPDGSIAQGPFVVEAPTGALTSALVESAKRALLTCQPFTMLRSEHYNSWKDLELKFDPQELLADKSQTQPTQTEITQPSPTDDSNH